LGIGVAGREAGMFELLVTPKRNVALTTARSSLSSSDPVGVSVTIYTFSERGAPRNRAIVRLAGARDG
jgi:hypothetical protein